MKFPKKLLIITHVPHWIAEDGSLFAYEPYVREVDIWANLFFEVVICAPRVNGQISGHQARFKNTNISWEPFVYSMEVSRFAWIKRFLQLPFLFLKIGLTIRQFDFIHLRSPGHPALIGQFFVRIFHKDSITKWAGFYGYFKGERLTSIIERNLVRSSGSKHIVLVYGQSQKKHEISFLPALMSTQELNYAKELASQKKWEKPWQLLSVGRITPAKGFNLAILGLGKFYQQNPEVKWKYTLVGDGRDLKNIQAQVKKLGIEDRVFFTGYLPFHEVQNFYASAHFVIMPGVKEGWPKVIAEAWAHGAIPVCASAGLTPQILSDPETGCLFEPNPEDLAAILSILLNLNPSSLIKRSNHIIDYANNLSLEFFENRLREVLMSNFSKLIDVND